VLKPGDDLPLSDKQQVLLVVVAVPDADTAAQAGRLSAVEAEVAAWLAAAT
jgi:hypothetical protein